jgi:hypothetical protein
MNSRTHRAVPSVLFGWLFTAACGARVDPFGGEPGSGGTTSETPGGSAGSGAASSGAGGGTAGGTGVPKYEGRLGIAFATSPTRVQIVSRFDGPDGHHEGRCVGVEGDCACRYSLVGGCVIDRCVAGAPLAPSPGPIVVKNLTTGVTRAAEPEREGANQSVTILDGFAAKVGDRFEISTLGADVPPFSVTLTAVEGLSLIEPDPVATRWVEIDRGQPLRVRWLPGPGRGRSLISTPSPSGGSTTINCELDDEDGDQALPTSVLGLLSPVAQERLYFTAEQSAQIVAGDWRVRVSVTDFDANLNWVWASVR